VVVLSPTVTTFNATAITLSVDSKTTILPQAPERRRLAQSVAAGSGAAKQRAAALQLKPSIPLILQR